MRPPEKEKAGGRYKVNGKYKFNGDVKGAQLRAVLPVLYRERGGMDIGCSM